MASSKRKQDEKNLKTLREIVSRPFNRQCFDCHQRGPTYANMTIGSFVCTACSGKLRGITPPHRVKSISMASFTADEIELLNVCGNEYCRRVWLALYDPQLGLEPDSKDGEKIKDFMTQKYEKKRFYVAPTESVKEAAKQANMTAASVAASAAPRQGSVMVGGGSIITGNRASAATTLASASTSSQRPTPTAAAPLATQPVPLAATSSASSPALSGPPLQSQASTSSATASADGNNFFGDFGNGDPFASPPTSTTAVSKPSNPASENSFANFDEAFGGGGASGPAALHAAAALFGTPATPAPSASIPPATSAPANASPFDAVPSDETNNWASFPAFDAAAPTASAYSATNGLAATVKVPNGNAVNQGVSSTPLVATSRATNQSPSPNPSGSTANGVGSASDRYAALAELDTIFSTSTSTTAPTIDWSGSSPTPATSSAPQNMPSTGLSVNPFSAASGASNSFFGTSPPGSSFAGPPLPGMPTGIPSGAPAGPSSSTNPFFSTGGLQPPTTSTMFSGAVPSGNLWGKPGSPSFGSSFVTDQSQSFKTASNPLAPASSTQFGTSISSSPFALSQQQQQTRPFHPSMPPTAAPAPFGGTSAAPVNNLFGSAFDASAASAFGAASHQLQQQQHYQQNLFASTTHAAPPTQQGAANPFLNGGGMFAPTAAAGERHPGVGGFPFAANGQQQTMSTAGSVNVPTMGRVAGNPFL